MTTFSRRLRHTRIPLAVAALVVVCAAIPVDSGAASASPHRTVVTRWMTTHPVCAVPKDPAAVRCYAQVALDVPRGTDGAVPVHADASGHGPTGGYSPADLAKAYGYDRAVKLDQTVAIVDWYDDPYALADLNYFDRHYGLPAETSTSFRKVNQQGHTSPLPSPSRSLSGEIALDIEAVRAVCAHCRILLVEADKPTDTDLAKAENTAARLGADEISNSWGGSESSDRSTTLEKAFRHPGVVVTASTGDDGWYGWDYSYPKFYDSSDDSPSFPATSPYVVSVGGTRLTVNTDGTRKAEVVWNGNRGAYSTSDGGATGGGCSSRYAAPAWQGHEAGYRFTDCRGKRLAADVSALADPRYGFDVWNRYDDPSYNPDCHTSKPDGNCWGRTGGTSLSSPVVAAMYALAGGSGGSAYPAASLYVNSNRTPSSRYDVTLGGNGYCGGDTIAACSDAAYSSSGGSTDNPNGVSPYGDLWDCSYSFGGYDQTPARSNAECSAGTGLDGPSGLGTPRGLRLFADTSPGAVLTVPTKLTHAHPSSVSAVLRATSGAHIATVSWSWGDGTSTTGRIASTSRATHTYKKAGTYRLTLTVRDSLSQLVYRSRTLAVR